MLFQNVTLVLGLALWERADLRVVDGRIKEVSSTDRRLKPLRGEEIIEGNGDCLAPGFIDLHVHGALGRDAMEATPEAFDAIRSFHASGGTTSLALTTVCASSEDIRRVLALAAIEKDKEGGGARLLGLHLEGPCFSPQKAGAHRAEFIRLPTPPETAQWLKFSDAVTQVTLAPEVPGALELIQEVVARGIIASGGHSDAWDDEARRGFEAGMSQATHLFNAMSVARRRGPLRVAGLTEFALSEPRMQCELIADAVHVSPTLLQMAYRAKGADGITLVTDACAGAGLPDRTAYRLGGLACTVRDGAGFTADGNALAGSTSQMIDCVRNMVRLAGASLPEAVRMATWNPARALKYDRRRAWHPLWGSLSVGTSADLVLLTREALEVRATYVGGRRVFPR